MGKPVFRKSAPTTGTGASSDLAFPDVCKTPAPGGPVPIPYPHLSLVGQSRKEVQVAKRVLIPRGAREAPVPEPGTSKSLLSPNRGKVGRLRPHSMDVKVEGTQLSRSVSPSMHNSTAARPGAAPFAPSQTKALTPDDEHDQLAGALLEQVDEVLAEYETALRRSPSFTPRQADRIQREFEARLAGLLAELEAAAGADKSHQAEVERLQRMVDQATAGRRGR